MKRNAFFIFFILAVSALSGQTVNREPDIGYIFPAGGARGQTVDVIAGGQYLQPLKSAHVTGEGVTVEVVKVYRSPRGVDRSQRVAVREKILNLLEARWSEMYQAGKVKNPRPPWTPARKKLNQANGKSKSDQGKNAKETAQRERPLEHPLLENLESKNLWELAHVFRTLFMNFEKRQMNRQLEESVLLRVHIADSAPLGKREIRLAHRGGLTNPVIFQVNGWPEQQEWEPNDPTPWQPIPAPPPFQLPVVINGQILPGDVDRFSFQGKAGQKLVIQAQARELNPFLADAVPGWFQATLKLMDAEGVELAFQDDYLFHPDPTLLFEVPRDGVYQVEIQDAIFRGREDFVYRLSLGEAPFVTAAFPLGGAVGEKVACQLEGWNLPVKTVLFPDENERGELRLTGKGALSNPIRYEKSRLSESLEREPNDYSSHSQKVTLPLWINGRIEKPGDVDLYAFEGKAGQKIVTEVAARRLLSPLDSVLHLMDSQGQVLAWNDDNVDKQGHLHRQMGLLTHHGDAYLEAQLPFSGTYYLKIGDTTGQGGKAYAYRLRLSEPQPDFELLFTPSSVDFRAVSVPLQIHVLRKDGFDGPVRLSLPNEYDGLQLDGAIVPAGENVLTPTLSFRGRNIPHKPFGLEIIGEAPIGGKVVRRKAKPAENTMQAFLWRHLAPTEEAVVSPSPFGRFQPRWAEEEPLEIPKGVKSCSLRLKTRQAPRMKDMELALSEAPEGVELGKVDPRQDGLNIHLKLDPEKLAGVGQENLIFEIIRVREVDKGGKKQTLRVPAGYLPALPVKF